MIFGMPLTKPVRFRLVDDLTRREHFHLTEEDKCIFLSEKTSHRDYSFSLTNQFIANIKKKPNSSNAYEKKYKLQAIHICSDFFKEALNPEWLKDAILVPIPPSKAVNDPEYDDRMERICKGIGPTADVRNIVVQANSMTAAHERGDEARITVDELLSEYSIDESLIDSEPKYIGIVDDVLTAGTHFRAMHTILSQRFPKADFTGIFVARRIFPDDD